MTKEFNLSEKMKGADLQVAYCMACRFLRSKSYPETNDYWRAVKAYCKNKLAGEKLT